MAVNKKIFRNGPGRERTLSWDFLHEAMNHSVEFRCCTLQRKDFTVNKRNGRSLQIIPCLDIPYVMQTIDKKIDSIV